MWWAECGGGGGLIPPLLLACVTEQLAQILRVSPL